MMGTLSSPKASFQDTHSVPHLASPHVPTLVALHRSQIDRNGAHTLGGYVVPMGASGIGTPSLAPMPLSHVTGEGHGREGHLWQRAYPWPYGANSLSAHKRKLGEMYIFMNPYRRRS